MKQGRTWVLLLCASVVPAQAQAPKPIASPSPEDLAQGQRLFAAQCARCHGASGTGGMGPSLQRPKLGRAPDDEALLGIIQDGIPGTAMGFASLSDLENAQVAAYVRSLGRLPLEAAPGDPVRGRLVYERAGCVTCHAIRGAGHASGPDLSEIGSRRGIAHLRQSLLDPPAAFPLLPLPYEPGGFVGYLPIVAVTRSGREVSGVRINEDSFSVQLRDAAGVLHSLRKSDLARLDRQPGTSVMPSYAESLSSTEIDDVVSYLASLGAEP
jgi:putative heme-binding domain-containing protein